MILISSPSVLSMSFHITLQREAKPDNSFNQSGIGLSFIREDRLPGSLVTPGLFGRQVSCCWPDHKEKFPTSL